jgi:hypothetical protein
MNKPKKVGAQVHNKHAEDLAQRIQEQLDGAWCVKLKELKDELKELLGHFKKLKGKDRIAGCRTWAEFCEKKLHRTDRAVRKMLNDTNGKGQQNSAEQSSASPKTEEPSEANAYEQSIAKDQAISKTIGYLDRFDGKEFRTKFAEFWRELRNELWDKIAPAGAKKPAATAILESVPESAEVV